MSENEWAVDMAKEAFEDGKAKGAVEERARIVSRLREEAHSESDPYTSGVLRIIARGLEDVAPQPGNGPVNGGNLGTEGA